MYTMYARMNYTQIDLESGSTPPKAEHLAVCQVPRRRRCELAPCRGERRI